MTMTKYVSFISLFIIISLQFSHSVTRNKNSQALNEKVQQLVDMSRENGMLRFDRHLFEKYIIAKPRNYSIVIMFTLDYSKYSCPICRKAEKKMEIVLSSYQHSQAYSNKLFFATIDYHESMKIFEMLRIEEAPTFIHFPPGRVPEKKGDTFNYRVVGLEAETIAKWINERTGVEIKIISHRDYAEVAPVMLFVLVAVVCMVYLRNFGFSRELPKTFCAIAAMFFCFTMVSGQMWNHIEKPPFAEESFEYISPTRKWQFVLESYLIAIYNAAIVLGMLLMIEAAAQKGNLRKRQVLVTVGLLLVVTFFSILQSHIKVKLEEYPYSYLFH